MRESRKIKKAFVSLSLSVLVCALNGLAQTDSQAQETIRLVPFKTHSRLILDVHESIPIELESNEKGFEIRLKGTSLFDLGQHPGEEKTWIEKIQGLMDSRLKGIEVSQEKWGVKLNGKWKFPSGKGALADPTMETFEYRQKKPHRYVLDFWHKRGPTLGEVRAKKKQDRLIASIKAAQQEQIQKFQRKVIKRSTHVHEMSFDQQCHDPLTEENTVFLKLFPAREPVNFSKWFSSVTADADYHYFAPKKLSKEAQYVRLALGLYSEGKMGLVIRTIEFFENEFPTSTFRSELRFLKANTLLKLGHQAEAEKLFETYFQQDSHSPEAFPAVTYLLNNRMKKNDAPLANLESFLWLIQQFPDHPLTWVFHLGAAENLYELKQVERSMQEYQWILDHAPTDQARAQAAFRMGDLFLQKFQYEQALATYFQGQAFSNAERQKYPNYYLNQAETLYQLNQWGRAEELFKKFLAEFPAHPEGWRATLRIGEIQSRLATNDKGLLEARKWFFETINRYPYAPGVTLARLRLLPCFDHGGLDWAGLTRFFQEEAPKFDGKGKVETKQFEDLRVLARVRATMNIGSFNQVTDVAVEELKNITAPWVKKEVQLIANVYFQKEIQRLISEGKGYEALGFFEKRKVEIEKADAQLSKEYLLGLAESAIKLGLGKLALEIIGNYGDIKGTPVELSSKPKLEEEQSDESDFYAAKAQWLLIRYGSTEVDRKNLVEHLEKVKPESPYAYQKEWIQALLSQEAGKTNEAISHLLRAQLLHESISVQGWLATLYQGTGQLNLALKALANLEEKLDKKPENLEAEFRLDPRTLEEKNIGVPLLPSKIELIESQVEVLTQMKRWGDASKKYAEILDLDKDNKKRLFTYARLLSKDVPLSKNTEAKIILEKMAKVEGADGETRYWVKLASEILEDEKKRESVKRYAKEGKR